MASEQRPRPEPLPPRGDSPEENSAPSRRRRSRGGGKLRLPRRRPLREGVLTAFSRALAVARRTARAAGEDPVAAVHEHRKALRRARAVVGLLVPSLGKRVAKGFRRHLQGAFRATGPLRDADVLFGTLGSVPPESEDDLARHAIEVALQLEQGRTRRETAETLSRGLRSLAPLSSALEVTLDPDFSAHDLERGLARSRRRERRALEHALESGRDEDLHAWRKRVKELRYQVELLASTGSRELRKREKALAELARDLGGVTDLALLAREIERRQKEGTIPHAPGLLERVGRLSRERSPALRERGARLFEDDPRIFARQVIAERG